MSLFIQVDRIIFTVFLDADKKIYEEELFNYFPIKSTESPKPSDAGSPKTDAAESTDADTPKLSHQTDSPKL